MVKKALVTTLIRVFQEAKEEGLVVDAIGLAPAYHEMAKDRYVLGVSAPSLSGIHKYDKMEIIFRLLWQHITREECGKINRVRVFNSVEDLDDHKYNDFDNYPDEGYEGIQRKLPELYPVG